MRGEGDPHTDTEAAYHEQQLLEEGDDPVTGDQPALPPDSILDSSGDEESHPVSSGPQVPHMASSARRPPTDTAASPGAVNTTYSVPAGAATPTEEGHAVATVQLDANSMYRVPKEPSAPLSEPAPPANIVSAMEGVAPATYSGSPPTEYFAIKNKLRIKNSFSDLIDGEKEVLIKPGTCGSFFFPGDTREYLCDVKVDIQAGSVISTSFNSVNMSCSCCGQFMFKSGNTGSTSRAVLILSDQAFPAAAPAARGDGGCLKVFRSESASLLDIVGGFLAVVGGWRLRPGSLILLSSASHLAHCGVEAYVNDFVLAAKTLQLKTGAEIGPAPILLMGGTNDKLLIRSLVDLATWQKRFYSNDRSFVADSISATIVALAEMGLGGRQPAYDCRYGLPSSISNTATKRYWISSGLSALPERIGPLTEALERTIITKMINFLNESHAFNLDPAPILDKQVAAPGTKSTDSVFVCVGNSHAKRTGLALRRAGQAVKEVLFPAWRPSAANIETMCSELAKELDKLPAEESTVVVLQVMDSFLYLARSEDGCVSPATKLQDGKFHVLGESILAEKEQQHRIFKLLVPLITLAKKHTVVIVPPLPRYLDRGCCSEPAHVSNLLQHDYKSKLEDQVYCCKNNLKDFSFTSGLRNCRVVAAWPAIKKRAGIWLDDPVHPAEVAYDDLAKVIMACLPKTADKRSSSTAWGNSGGGDGNRPGKRSRPDGHHSDRGGLGGRSPADSDHQFYPRGGNGGYRPHYNLGQGPYWRGGGGGGGGGGRGGAGRRGR